MSVFHFLTLVDGDKTGFVFDGEWHLESAAYPKPQTADQINHLLPMITKATQNPCKMADGTYTLDHQLRRFGGISNTTRAKTLMAMSSFRVGHHLSH